MAYRPPHLRRKAGKKIPEVKELKERNEWGNYIEGKEALLDILKRCGDSSLRWLQGIAAKGRLDEVQSKEVYSLIISEIFPKYLYIEDAWKQDDARLLVLLQGLEIAALTLPVKHRTGASKLLCYITKLYGNCLSKEIKQFTPSVSMQRSTTSTLTETSEPLTQITTGHTYSPFSSRTSLEAILAKVDNLDFTLPKSLSSTTNNTDKIPRMESVVQPSVLNYFKLPKLLQNVQCSSLKVICALCARAPSIILKHWNSLLPPNPEFPLAVIPVVLKTSAKRRVEDSLLDSLLEGKWAPSLFAPLLLTDSFQLRKTAIHTIHSMWKLNPVSTWTTPLVNAIPYATVLSEKAWKPASSQNLEDILSTIKKPFLPDPSSTELISPRIPLSQRLSLGLAAAHVGLILSISKESQPQGSHLMPEILKLAGFVAASTPYHLISKETPLQIRRFPYAKGSPGLLPILLCVSFRGIHQYRDKKFESSWSQSMSGRRKFGYPSLSPFFTTTHPCHAMMRFLKQSSESKSSPSSEGELLRYTLEPLGLKGSFISALISSARAKTGQDILGVLASLSRHYHPALTTEWRTGRKFLRRIIFNALQSDFPATISQALKILEEWSKVPLPVLQGNSEIIENVSFALRKSFFELEEAIKTVPFIINILKKGFEREVKGNASDGHRNAFHARAFSVLSQIPVFIFKLIPKPYIETLLNMGLKGLKSKHPSVRAGSCRFGGVICTYTEIIKDFTQQTHELFWGIALKMREESTEQIGEKYLSVKIRSCWALANICDPNIKINIHRDSPLLAMVKEEKFVEICRLLLNCLDQNSKLHPNAIRGLGNICHLLKVSGKTSISIAGSKVSGGFVKILLSICSRLKKRLKFDTDAKDVGKKSTWNASYAIGNLLSNPTLPSVLSNSHEASEAIHDVIIVLCQIVEGKTHKSNYKIRIHAAGALARIPSVAHFGKYKGFLVALKTLIVATIGYNPTKRLSFVEVQYEGKLKAMLYSALSHQLILCAEEKNQRQKIGEILMPKKKILLRCLETQIAILGKKSANPMDWDPNSEQLLDEFRLYSSGILPMIRKAKEVLCSFI